MVVQRYNSQCARSRRRELTCDMHERPFVQTPALMAPRPGRAEADDEKLRRPMDGPNRTERVLVPGPRSHEPSRGVRNVVVARHCEDGRPETREELPCLRKLLRPPAMRQVACRDDELGRDIGDEFTQRAGDIQRRAPDMEIRDMDERQAGTRLSSLPADPGAPTKGRPAIVIPSRLHTAAGAGVGAPWPRVNDAGLRLLKRLH